MGEQGLMGDWGKWRREAGAGWEVPSMSVTVPCLQ